MRSPSPIRSAILFLSGSVLLLAAPALAAAPHLDPLISGESSYVDGTFAATDYAYDDRGAQVEPSLPGGDTEYPPELPNAADLIQVQIDLVDGALHAVALLQTIADPSAPLVGFAFDTDADPATGAAALPGGGWVPAAPLGVDLLLVVSQGVGELYEFSAGTWTLVSTIPSHVDPALNTVEATLPVSLGAPGTDTWRAFVVAGLAQDSWLTGGPIYDLGFLRGETVADQQAVTADILQGINSGESTLWQDHLQADILAGTADPAPAAALIDFGRVAAGDTELATADGAGWHTFLYRSELDLGEGVLYGQTGFVFFPTNVYLGRYQPYLVFRNDDPPAAAALVMFMHGATENHLQNTFWFEDTSGQIIPFDYPGIVVFPLGRGESMGYTGISQRDVLDVLDDAQARLPVDPERTILSGFSMGGIGTYRLGWLYPDRWSTAISHAGTTAGDSFDDRDLLQNTLNLPFRIEVGVADPLVSPAIYQGDRDAWVALNHNFRFYEVFDGTHQLQPHLMNCELLAAATRPRVVDPPRVRYAVQPATFESDPVAGYEFVYDSAYWVSGIEVRSGATIGTIDAVSLARADRTPSVTPVDQQSSADGNDYCGPNPDITLGSQPTGNTWREVSAVHEPGPSQPVSNEAEIEFVDLAAATLDLTRMSLVTTDLTLHVSGDGLTDLTLVGPWGAEDVDVLKDGQPFGPLVPSGGAVVLTDDMAGEHVYTLPEPSLSSGLLVGASALVLALRRRRREDA